MKRSIGIVLVMLAALAVAWYLNRDPNPGAKAWKVVSAADVERLKAEKGMKASASSLKGMKAATVDRVVDGDTVQLRVGGSVMKARLLNVNTPETVDPRRPVQTYGKEASNFAKSVLTGGSKVYYRYDVEKEDKYGRHLVHLYLEDGTWFNALLVRAGFAQRATYPPNVSAADFFGDLQKKAREEGLGLWQIPKK